jgi:RNA polymerase sigma factor (sigma-70 family)
MSGAAMGSAELYAACRRQGSAAQLDAFEQLAAHLYRVAHAMLRDRNDGQDLAADCVQLALIKVHQHLDQCREPEAFQGWAARILRRTVLDALRHAAVTRSEALPEDGALPQSAIIAPPADPDELAELLRSAIASAPLSDRSRRVVVGRFFEDRDDHDLARAESEYASQVVLPSHVQVTRAKNLAKLRSDTALIAQLRLLIET